MSARVVFLGTPLFAVPSLDALARLAQRGAVEIAIAVTQPDRPGDRGRIAVPPVKERALALGLTVLQPGRLDRSAVEAVRSLRPDLLVWAAYGNLIPRALLDLVGGRAVNVHASLLPRWRGAAPVPRAILTGDAETGVTLMEGTAELDAGPILAQERTPIGETEDAGALTARLALLGAALLERELPRYLAGALPGSPQDAAAATYAPKMTSADGALDFARPAEELARRVRACTPDPGAFTTVRGQRLVVSAAAVTGGTPDEHGMVRLRDGVPHVAAGAGWLRLEEVRPAGKRTMTGAEWARGTRELAGLRLPS
ncbi:MAG TPA: methionyl-tRNA formyltransferase [Candidatus Limnocylindria bacterium]|nr:methionyl-tRNA formyltransferase [Candidatus Limnocylindria bacterium]